MGNLIMKSNFYSKASAICLFILILNSILYSLACELNSNSKSTKNNENNQEENLQKHNKNPAHDFKKQPKRKCFHFKKDRKKHYLSSFSSRKSAKNHYKEIPFEYMRIHFDYSMTLPHEEKMLKNLVMPPVKKFFENTLKVRRVLGKLRIPRNMNQCQDIPVPKHLKNDGVDADLIIMVSTYRGVKKYNFENFVENENEKRNKMKKSSKKIKENMAKKHKNGKSSSNILNHFLENFFKSGSTKEKEIEENKNTNKTTNKDTNKTEEASKEEKEKPLPWEENDAPEGVVGWSSSCIQDLYTLRPVVGIMQYVADINPSPRAIEEAVWTTLHEITHVLGFDYDLFGDFVDENYDRKSYDKVIKIKTRLVGLDKMLKERQHLMDDFSGFMNFEENEEEDEDLKKNKKMKMCRKIKKVKGILFRKE